MTATSNSIKLVLTAFGTSVALALVTAVPSETAFATVTDEERRAAAIQQFTTDSYSPEELALQSPEIAISEEWLKAEEDRKAKEAKAKEEEEAAARLAASTQSGMKSGSRVYRDIPAGEGAQGLVDAALAQVGVQQDCTDLVQNSLAAIGLTQTRANGGFDLGTGIWDYDRYGTRVDINELAPGDILIYGNASSGAHVAIYIGNGQAVHGGWGGFNTQVGPADAAFQPLTGAVRV